MQLDRSPESQAPLFAALRNRILECGWALQDLQNWPENTRFFYKETASGISFLLKSGHPANQRFPTFCVGGDPVLVRELLKEHLPPKPFVVKESDLALLPVIQEFAPDSVAIEEYQMLLDRESFIEAPGTNGARRLQKTEVSALLEFYAAPPNLDKLYEQWLQNALVFGIFKEDRLASMASTMIRLPEINYLAAVETKEAFRGLGLATQVISALSRECFKLAPLLALTVRKDNPGAKALYEKFGFKVAREVVWVDAGTGLRP